MSAEVKSINPEILIWARLSSGLSIDDVASLFNKDFETIDNWEKGESFPTYVQLENLAYKIYKRPIAIFFFPHPPEESDPSGSFRTLPQFEIDNLNTDTRFAIRQASMYKLYLDELNDGINPTENKIFEKQKININDSIESSANEIRKYLGVSIEEQFSWSSSEQAFKVWRNTLQDFGIFVFKRAFKQLDISGFCLLDDIFPIVIINNSTPFNRQTFTLLHELSHILIGESGITKIDDSFIDQLTDLNRNIEIYCNKLAAEILIPSKIFNSYIGDPFNDKIIEDTANRFSVSREVILRKYLENKLVDSEYYRKKSEQWTIEYKEYRKSDKSGGGNYYATQASYLGNAYLRIAFSKYYQGKVSIEQLSDYLNVKTKHIPALETFASQHGYL